MNEVEKRGHIKTGHLIVSFFGFCITCLAPNYSLSTLDWSLRPEHFRELLVRLKTATAASPSLLFLLLKSFMI